jgi:uncharacterized ferritin-like protein (DUF455 family)
LLTPVVGLHALASLNFNAILAYLDIVATVPGLA